MEKRECSCLSTSHFPDFLLLFPTPCTIPFAPCLPVEAVHATNASLRMQVDGLGMVMGHTPCFRLVIGAMDGFTSTWR